ncbi:hypothetical protein HKL94_01585 [Candidatus Parcubacteria bacterium]|nr:hypothetical protein [Candidatus Parcubacteria bacterium]
MNTILLLIIGVLAVVLLCVLVGVIAVKRLAKPLLERGLAGKELADKESGNKKTSSPTQPKSMGGGRDARLKRYLWPVILTIGIALVILELIFPAASIEMSILSHWLPILTGLSILLLLVSLYSNALGEDTAKTLKKALILTAVVLFVEIPFGGRMMSPTVGKPQHAVQRVVPMRALPQSAPNLPRAWNADGTITDMSKWPRVRVPPHGDSVRVPNIFGGHLVWGGSGFKVHCVYADGHEGIIGNANDPCSDGNIVSMYAHNDGGVLLYASYAYAKMGEK